MKLVTLTAADLENFKKSLPAEKAPAVDFHREALRVDAVSIELVRPNNSEDPKTNAYSINFKSGESEYVIIVRPTVHQMPSITLDIITRVGGKEGNAEFSSYTVLRDTVTTLKGQVSGVPATETIDLASLIDRVQVQ